MSAIITTDFVKYKIWLLLSEEVMTKGKTQEYLQEEKFIILS